MAEKEKPVPEAPAAPAAPAASAVPMVLREVDKEDASIASFMARKCSCKRGFNSSPCSTLFPWDYIKQKRKVCHSLTSEQLDMLIMGQLLVHRRYPNFVKEYKRRRNHHRPSSAEEEDKGGFRSSSKYYVADMPVCEFTFQFLHTLSKKRLRNIISHLDVKGPVPRVHGSKGKPPSNTFGPEKIEEVVAFIKSVAEKQGHTVPAKAKSPGKTKLPLELSKAAMYRDYAAECEKEGRTAVGRSSFKRIWLDHIPSVSSSHKPVFTKSPGKAKVYDKGAGRGRKRSGESGQPRGTSKRGRKSGVNTGSQPTNVPIGGHSALNMYMNSNPSNIDGHSINLGPVPSNAVSQPMMSTPSMSSSSSSHPTNTYSHSMNAGGHSMNMSATNMGGHSMNVGSHPPDMDNHPANTDVYPTNMSSHALSMGSQPMNMGSFLMNMGIEMCYRTNTST